MKTISSTLYDNVKCSKIRNFCILGHIDSGKTTISDYLISVANFQLSGELRFMDHRNDEQLKKITMKTSCYSFPSTYFSGHVFNLLDTPGHLDFFSEIKQGIVLSEGILLVVSSIKGIESQTIQIINYLKKYLFQKKIILVINKIDRLILEKECEKLDIYLILKEIIYDLNVLFDSENYFDPVKGNVFFCSAIDGFGFSIPDVAEFYDKNLPQEFIKDVKKEDRVKFFWGEYFLKDNKIIYNKNISDKILFCKTILGDLFFLYKKFYLGDSKRINEKVAKKFKIKLITYDKRKNLKKIFNRFLQIKFGLESLIQKNTNPPKNMFRNHLIIGYNNYIEKNEDTKEKGKSNFLDSKKIILLYCIKFLEIQSKFIGFAKNYGESSITEGVEVFINDNDKIKIKQLYVLKGSGIIPTKTIPKGGIFGLEFESNDNEAVSEFKNGFLISDLREGDKIPLMKPYFLSKPVISYCITPVNSQGYQSLIIGLKKLSMVDPSIKIFIRKNGENIIKAEGDVHLERLLYDLTTWGIKYFISKPIISYKETVFEKSKTVFESNDILDISLHVTGNLDEDEIKSFEKNIIYFDEKNNNYIIKHDDFSKESNDVLQKLKDKIINGFSIGIKNGYICQERLMNTVFVVEKIQYVQEVDTSSISIIDELDVISLIKKAMLKALSKAKPKLLEPFFKCVITVNNSVVRECISVIKQRRAKIIDSYPKKNDMFFINARIPVVTTIGMINEIRTETSGLATVVLGFDKYYDMEDQEEEKEAIEAILRRKGQLEEVLILDPEKQRNLSKKKNKFGKVDFSFVK